MTTRAYFRYLRGRLYAEQREACLDICEIAEHIVRGNNPPKYEATEIRGVLVVSADVWKRWEQAPLRAEECYVALLAKIEIASNPLYRDPREPYLRGILL